RGYDAISVHNCVVCCRDFSRGRVTLVNDTFSGNGCGGSFSCGGIIFDSHQSSTATNITVVGNDQGVAGLDTLQNSIVVGNTVDCSHFLHSALQSVSNSINSDGTCRAATGQATTVDPQLAALAANGGLVKTMAL